MMKLLDGKRLILASNSPRRKELLGGLDVDFDVRVLNGIDESFPETLAGEDIPKYISQQKAKAYMPSLAADEVLVTSDTIVYLDREVLGKPKDADDARRMLRLISGRSHDVITGVTIVSGIKINSFSVTTKVTFKQLSDDEIDYYIENYRPFDKAGAYGIQEWIGYIGVTSIEGSYFNVMGLPVQRLYQELVKM
ncbi:MAG: septum formation protein Maf [Prevotellaceae bacterium]|nr:septum formation protein Maf [Candidatus Colivivens caballi]